MWWVLKIQIVLTILLVVAAFFVVRSKHRSNRSKPIKDDLQSTMLMALINNMGDAVITTDSFGRVTVYNAATLSLLDTNKNIRGMFIDKVLNLQTDKSKKISIYDEAVKINKVFSRSDLYYHFSPSDRIKLYVNAAPVKHSYKSGLEKGYIFILRDITSEHQTHEERGEFMSLIGQELSAPIAIAEGSISNIKLFSNKQPGLNVISKSIDSAHEQILHLTRLISNLTVLSRVEHSHSLTKDNVDLTTLLHKFHRKYFTKLKQQKVALDLSIHPPLPKLVIASGMVEEILHQIMEYLVIYSHPSSIKLHVKHQGGGVEFQIVDDGLGITQNEISHIFDKSYRPAGHSGGAFLGLYVAHTIARKLGFKIDVESRLNHGTKFKFRIPENYIQRRGKEK